MTTAELFTTYILPVLAAALTALAGFLGTQMRSLCREYLNDRVKRDVARTCVRAVEQLYRDLGGAEKLEKAKEGICGMLAEKHIPITELELNLLIESMVSEFNIAFSPRALPEGEAPETYSEEGTSR